MSQLLCCALSETTKRFQSLSNQSLYFVGHQISKTLKSIILATE